MRIGSRLKKKARIQNHAKRKSPTVGALWIKWRTPQVVWKHNIIDAEIIEEEKKDKDNFYYLVGRKDRFAKIFGNRVNLFEIEEILIKTGIKVICQSNDTNIINIIGNFNDKTITEMKKILNINVNLNPSIFKFIKVKKLPINQNFKLNYNL